MSAYKRTFLLQYMQINGPKIDVDLRISRLDTRDETDRPDTTIAGHRNNTRDEANRPDPSIAWQRNNPRISGHRNNTRDKAYRPDARKPRYTYAVSNYRPHSVLRTTVLPYGSYGNKPYRANSDNTRRKEHQGTCDGNTIYPNDVPADNVSTVSSDTTRKVSSRRSRSSWT
ncbi:uncharacterized protein LOC119180609 [Rhipicephalus microplus]|uniref:uncharacterized protein LOC119180609 n=1 Tax=Rhipicephalus microplus TaxID=6941 RepID=UPI003F6BDA0C